MPLEIVRSDITTMKVDAVVSAANRFLEGGGGVDGAIRRAAGRRLDAACRKLGGCETGEAKITGGYRLPAKYVIHTVGPVWQGGDQGEEEQLASCYRHSLELALENKCRSVAFPLISAETYGFPKDQALAVALDTIGRFLMENEMMVYLVVFAREEYAISKKLFSDVQAFIDDHYVSEHADSDAVKNRRSPGLSFAREGAKARPFPPPDSAKLSAFRKTSPKGVSGGLAKNRPMPRETEDASYLEQSAFFPGAPADGLPCGDMSDADWKKLVQQTDEGFSGMLLRLIDEKKMKDSECYKRANVTRQLFSRIRSRPDYTPSKTTALAFAVALRLTLKETEDLLRKAGLALTNCSKLDVIVVYCIQHQQYDINYINGVLFQFDLQLLGCFPLEEPQERRPGRRKS